MDLHIAITPELVASSRSATADAPLRPTIASTTGGVAEALAAHDVELGLGRGGAILSAAESAARSSDAAVEGSATFDVAV